VCGLCVGLGGRGLDAKVRQLGVGGGGGGGGVLWEFLGGDEPLGPWNPWPIPELVQLNFATLY